MNWTEEDYQNFLERRGKKPEAPKKRNKYGAVKTWRDGVSFDSKKEADYYDSLKLLHKAGAIAGYIVHGKMICTAGTDASDRAVTYEPDFIILENDGTYKIIDTKSDATITPLFKTKMKALKEKFPDVEIVLQK